MGYSEPRAGRSPLFYIGMGCLVLVGIGFVGCVALGFAGFNMVKGLKDEATKPIPQEQVIANLKDIPRYPNAPLIDVPATRMMRAGMMLMKKTGAFENIEVGIFGPKDPYEKIRAFYDSKLKAAGYTAVKESEDLENNSKQWAYRKGTTIATFQYSKMTKEQSGADIEKEAGQPVPTYEGPVLTIMRMDGVKEGTNINGITRGKGAPGSFDSGE